MDLGDLNHRDYVIGGAIFGLIIALLIVLGVSVTTLLFLGALAFSAGYVYYRNEGEDLFGTAHGTEVSVDQTFAESDVSEEPKSSSRKKKWKVIIGDYHTPSSADNSPEGMDRSMFGRKGRLGMSPLAQSPVLRSAGGNRRTSMGLMSAASVSGMDRSSLGLSPDSRRASLGMSPGGSGLPLPRVRRINDSRNESSPGLYSPVGPGSPLANPSARRYPTHQPKYPGVGTLPPVQLKRIDRPVLSEHNSTMLRSPVTVKVAPPDVLKPPVPSVIATPTKASQPGAEPEHDPRNTQTVLTAIREKRKRIMREDDEDVEIQPTGNRQDNKRRRQAASSSVAPVDTPSTAAEDQDHSPTKMDVSPRSLKRPALSRYREDGSHSPESGETLGKRVRSKAPNTTPPQTSAGITGRVRNPIEVSYSSSKRWLEKQKLAEKEEALNSSRRITRSRSREPSSKRLAAPDDGDLRNEDTSNSATSALKGLPPKRMLSLVDQDTPMKDDTQERSKDKEPTPSTSSATDDLQTADVTDLNPKKKLFPQIHDSTSKRRHTPIRGDSHAEFSKVPTLRYSLTVEDYEKDRASDMERVDSMLQEVEEAHAAKNAKKDQPATSESTSTTSSSGITSKLPTTSTSTLSLPQLTSTITTTSTPSLPTTSATVNPLLQKNTFSSSKPASTASVSPAFSLTNPLQASASTTAATTASVPSGLGSLSSTGKPAETSTTSSSATSLLFHHSPVVSSSASPAPSTTGLAPPPSYSASVSNAPSPASTTQYSFNPVFKPQTTAAPAGSATTVSATAAATKPATASAPGPSFSLGGAPATVQSSSSATAPGSNFSFGASSTTAPSGNVASGFTFGNTTTSTAPTGLGTQSGGTTGFNFGGSTQQPSTGSSNNKPAPANSGFSFGGSATSSTSTTTAAAPSTFTFGNTNATPTAKPSPAFGNSTAQNTFGAAAPPATTTTASSSTGFNFGPSTNTFGSNKPAAGPTFGAPTATPSFGSAQTATTPSTGFQFNTTTTQANTATPSIFGQGPSAAPAFGSANTSSTTSASTMFGQPSTAGAFGQQAVTSTATASTAFGSTPAPTTGPTFGGTSAPANTGFQFGGSTNAQKISFTGNQVTTQAAPTGQTSTFTFGGSGGNTNTNKPGVIAFGQSAPTTTAAASTGSAFGGGSGNNAFGTGSTSNFTFNAGKNTQNAFGSTSTTQNQAFGGSTTGGSGSVFSAGQPATTTGFAAPAQNQPNKGFDFSAASKPNMNFGQSSQPQPNMSFGSTNTQQQSNPITFGTPNNSASFNFNGGGATAFGSGAPSTPQSGTNTPLFGTPTQPGGAGPVGFSPGAGFILGTGNTQARPRAVARASRRRTTKR